MLPAVVVALRCFFMQAGGKKSLRHKRSICILRKTNDPRRMALVLRAKNQKHITARPAPGKRAQVYERHLRRVSVDAYHAFCEQGPSPCKPSPQPYRKPNQNEGSGHQHHQKHPRRWWRGTGIQPIEGPDYAQPKHGDKREHEKLSPPPLAPRHRNPSLMKHRRLLPFRQFPREDPSPPSLICVIDHLVLA